MRADIVPGSKFPDYQLPDHTNTPRKLSELQGDDPMILTLALRQEIPDRSVGMGIGHFFGALRIDGFIDPNEFKRQIDEWVRVFRAAKPAPGTPGVIIPGDPERQAEAELRVTGVPLGLTVVADLRDIADRTGIPFD